MRGIKEQIWTQSRNNLDAILLQIDNQVYHRVDHHLFREIWDQTTRQITMKHIYLI